MKNKENLIKARQELVWNEYQKLINSKQNIMIEIEATLERLHMTLERFIKILMSYINEFTTPDSYMMIFDTLLTSDNPEEYLKGLEIDVNTFNEYLQNYLLYRRPDILFTNKKLLNKLNRLAKLNEKMQIQNLNDEKMKEGIAIIEKNIQDFINCPYSIERFCMQRNLNQGLFSTQNGLYPRQLSLYNKSLYQDYLNNLDLKNKLKDIKLKEDVINILKQIKDNSSFDVIDFYNATIYGPVELIEYAKTILDSSDFKLFHDTLSYFKKIIISIGCNIAKEMIDTKLSFTIDDILIETTKEDREKFYSY